MTTPKIVMPELAVGQAGKEITHNDALAIIDQLLQARVVDKDLATPPGSPANGAAYIVASSPTGAWAGHTNGIAFWLTAVGVWQFLIPAAGWRVWVTDESKYYEFSGSAWAQSAAFTGGTLTSALNEAPIVTLASAATVNIGAAAANTISISGTTTITAFDSIASGAIRRLYFQGVLTLTHNAASLILPAGVNISTMAGDVAEFVSLGSGNWRCTYYTRAGGGTFIGAYNESTIVSLASAATVNIAAAAANTINITGTTTITSLGAATVTAYRRLVFQGTLTLTHNAASLILPTGANIVTAAGDVAEFIAVANGDWRCTSYQRANGTTPALGPTSDPTFDTLTLTSGQIVFPATQVPSANANTLDDYEEGTWTPVLTFSTVGDLSVTYTSQIGTYVKVGKLCVISFDIITSAFTHTTASGDCRITGLPFTSGGVSVGSFEWQGVTKSGYTNLMSLISASGVLASIVASGSGLAAASVTAADMPTGGSVLYRGTQSYGV